MEPRRRLGVSLTDLNADFAEFYRCSETEIRRDIASRKRMAANAPAISEVNGEFHHRRLQPPLAGALFIEY